MQVRHLEGVGMQSLIWQRADSDLGAEFGGIGIVHDMFMPQWQVASLSCCRIISKKR